MKSLKIERYIKDEKIKLIDEKLGNTTEKLLKF